MNRLLAILVSLPLLSGCGPLHISAEIDWGMSGGQKIEKSSKVKQEGGEGWVEWDKLPQIPTLPFEEESVETTTTSKSKSASIPSSSSSEVPVEPSLAEEKGS